MARTLASGPEAEILRANPDLTFRDGAYTYAIRRDGQSIDYSVSDGKQTVSAPVAWAFGLGAAGQTYVFERDGHRYESRVSFFRDIGGLGLTLGARNASPRNINEAAGRQMTPQDEVECFGCHSFGAVRESKLNLETVVAGVQCESCHAGAGRHAAAVGAGDSKAAAMPKLAGLNTDAISELCGRCHRTWADIAARGPMGVENVRFQGYRLTNSKCYDPFDRRISCVACHDPHQEVERRSASYDAKCLACHLGRRAPHSARGSHAPACPSGKQDCAGCHMPRYEIPGSHHRFSDHQIRIVRANEAYPN